MAVLSGLQPAEANLGWLGVITTTESFFRPCAKCSHKANGREVTVNYFDIDTAEPDGLCSLCVHERPGHRVLQIRRSSYHDVVKVGDVAKLADIGGVQTYVINSSKVIFLKRRPQPRPPKGAVGSSQCIVCARHLQDVSLFCSLQCKVDSHGGVATMGYTEAQESSGSQNAPGTPSRPDGYEHMRNPSSDGETSQEGSHCSSQSRRKGYPRRSPFE